MSGKKVLLLLNQMNSKQCMILCNIHLALKLLYFQNNKSQQVLRNLFVQLSVLLGQGISIC